MDGHRPPYQPWPWHLPPPNPNFPFQNPNPNPFFPYQWDPQYQHQFHHQQQLHNHHYYQQQQHLLHQQRLLQLQPPEPQLQPDPPSESQSPQNASLHERSAEPPPSQSQSPRKVSHSEKKSPASTTRIAKFDAVAEKARAELREAGEHVSTWKVGQAAMKALEVDYWDSLGFQMREVPALQRIMATEGKVMFI